MLKSAGIEFVHLTILVSRFFLVSPPIYLRQVFFFSKVLSIFCVISLLCWQTDELQYKSYIKTSFYVSVLHSYLSLSVMQTLYYHLLRVHVPELR